MEQRRGICHGGPAVKGDDMLPAITYDRLHNLAMTDNRQVGASLVDPLNLRLAASSINTITRLVHFLGQVCHESGFFQRLSENLNYSSADRIGDVWPKLKPRAASLVHNPMALGNAAYAHMNGNGDEASGDGYLFRGRGLIQLTGRGNYVQYGTHIGVDLIGNPDMASYPDNAVRLAIAFWEGRGCNAAADRDSVHDVTALINPALEGMADRSFLTSRAKTIFVQGGQA